MTTINTENPINLESTDWIADLTDEQLDKLESRLALRAIRRKAEQQAREKAARPKEVTHQGLRESFFAKREGMDCEADGAGHILFEDGSYYTEPDYELGKLSAKAIRDRSRFGAGTLAPTDPRELTMAKLAFYRLKKKNTQAELQVLVRAMESERWICAVNRMPFQNKSMLEAEKVLNEKLELYAGKLKECETLVNTLAIIEEDCFGEPERRKKLIEARMKGERITLRFPNSYQHNDPLIARGN